MDTPFPLDHSADTLFAGLDLGDRRRHKRFARVVQAMADRPGVSLPQLFPNPTQYHACLNLFDTPHCSHAALLEAHRQALRPQLAHYTGPLLVLHDTTLLDYSGHTSLADQLGPIGNGGGQGWVAHHSLAVDPSSRLVVGLLSQILHVRHPAQKGLAKHRARPERESRLWQHGVEAIGELPPSLTVIHVGDRGADIYEFLAYLVDQDQRFLVRSTQNRALGSGPTGHKAEGLLHDHLRGLPTQAVWTLAVPGRPEKPPRQAQLHAAAAVVELRLPHKRRGESSRRSLTVTAVRVWEVDPPSGVKPLEWILLSSEPVPTASELRQLAQWYACRMMIEEFHKAMKTGAGVEGFQVRKASKLAALVAVTSVVAVGLLNLRQAGRDPVLRERPAAELVPEIWIGVLARAQGKPAAKLATVEDFWVELARLGGYQKDPRKHPPGWITLWRGWSLLHLLLRYHANQPEKMP